jgi:hypothetical protein
LWRDQIKRFEAGKYYKSIPLELVCEALESFSESPAKPTRTAKPAKEAKPAPPETAPPKEHAPKKPPVAPIPGPTVEGE